MTKEIGDFGERAAREYLEERGYEILETNFRLKCGEIDIIAEKDGCTVFVEVKTRGKNALGSPSEYVDVRKQAKIKKTALCYINSLDADMRFDVIEVFYARNGGGFIVEKINHIENAF